MTILFKLCAERERSDTLDLKAMTLAKLLAGSHIEQEKDVANMQAASDAVASKVVAQMRTIALTQEM